MMTARPQPEKHVRKLRFAAVVVCAMVLIALVVAAVERLFAISPDSSTAALVHGAIFGGGGVAAIAIINALIRNGRCKWLIEENSARNI